MPTLDLATATALLPSREGGGRATHLVSTPITMRETRRGIRPTAPLSQWGSLQRLVHLDLGLPRPKSVAMAECSATLRALGQFGKLRQNLDVDDVRPRVPLGAAQRASLDRLVHDVVQPLM